MARRTDMEFCSLETARFIRGNLRRMISTGRGYISGVMEGCMKGTDPGIK